MVLSEPRLDFGSIARNPSESVRPDLWPDHAWVPALGNQGNMLVDVAGKADATAVGTPIWGADRLLYDDTFSFAANAESYSADRTFFFSGQLDNGGTYWQGILSDSASASTGLHLFRYSSTFIGIILDSVELIMTVNPGTMGVPQVMCLRVKGDSVTLWRDGEYVIGRTRTPTTTGTGLYRLGCTGWNTGDRLYGQICEAAVYSKALTPSQITDLSVDPFLPFRRAPQVSYFVAAAAASIVPIIINQARRRRT